MNDDTLHRNHSPSKPLPSSSAVALSSPPRMSSCTSCLDAASVHKHSPYKTKVSSKSLDHNSGDDENEEDLTCEMSLSTLETSIEPCGNGRGFLYDDGEGPASSTAIPRYGRGDTEGSSSFTELALSSMDMDRHGTSSFGGAETEHHPRRGCRRYDNSHSDFEESYCDGMGESMFGESFALEDGGNPSFDVEAHMQQRRAFHASQEQLLVFEEDAVTGEDDDDDHDSTGAARASAEVTCPM